MKQPGALEKAFAVLERLAEAPERWQPLAEIAEACAIHRATAAHVLRRLVASGYAEQDGARGGYRLGPAAWALTRGAPYRRDLVAAAEPRMAALAGVTGESVVLVALRGGRRLRLCRVEGGGAVRVDDATLADDNAYNTPTGRLLLAHAPPHERETLLALRGLPGPEWPEARTRATLDAALAKLRAHRGCLVLAGAEVVGLACALTEDDAVPAALGLYLPASRFKGRRRRELVRHMEAAAAEISSALTERMNRGIAE